MKITVLGAGTIGSAVAYDLCRHEQITRIQVCDAHHGALQDVKRRVTSPKLRTNQVNARDTHALGSLLRGSACVISCADSSLNQGLADLAVSLGIHFCDLGSSEQSVQDILNLEDRARSKGAWMVPNCGLAPGLINIVCMHAVEQFDEVDTVHLRVGSVPLDPQPPFNFQVTFSAEKLLDDYTHPVILIEDGDLKAFDPMTGKEKILFPEPFNTLEAFYAAGALSTLPSGLLGRVRTLDYKKISYPGHADQMHFAIALGFAEPRSIDVRTHRTYRDVFVRNIRKCLGDEKPDAVLLRVVATGMKDGRRQSFVAEMIDRYREDENLTAIKRCTAFPASIVATLLVHNEVPGGGASPPELIIPKPLFFEELRKRDINLTMQWADGVVHITNGIAAPVARPEA